MQARAWISGLPVREILRAGHATALKVASTLLMLVFSIFGGRLLGAETFGVYVSLFAIAGLLSVATSVGLPALLQREFAASRGSGDRSSLKPLVQGLTIINGFLLIGLVTSLSMGFLEALLIISFCLVSNAAGILGALFVAHERVMLANWIGGVIRPGAAVLVLLILGVSVAPSFLLPLFAQIAGVLASAVILLVLWRGEPLTNAIGAFRTEWWSERHSMILRAGLVFAGTQILVNLTTQVDILLLTVMASPEDVAHYYAAVRAALVVQFFFGVSGLLAEPTFTRLHAANAQQEVQMQAMRTTTTGAIVTIAAAVFAVVLAPYYLALYGESFTAAYTSLCIFVSGIVIRSFFGPAAPLLRAVRAERSLLIITAFVLLLNTVLSVALIPRFGMEGAAIATAVQFAAYGPLLAYAVKRHSGYRSDILCWRATTKA